MRVHVSRDASGVLRELSANGHAGFALKGQDIVCAAASVLLLSVARTMETGRGIEIAGGAEQAGALRLRVASVDPAQVEWGRGVTAMFLKGMGDLAAEYPDQVSLTVTEI